MRSVCPYNLPSGCFFQANTKYVVLEQVQNFAMRLYDRLLRIRRALCDSFGKQATMHKQRSAVQPANGDPQAKSSKTLAFLAPLDNAAPKMTSRQRLQQDERRCENAQGGCRDAGMDRSPIRLGRA